VWTRRCYCFYGSFIEFLIPRRLDQPNIGDCALPQDGKINDHLSNLSFVGERKPNRFCVQIVGFVLDVLRYIDLVLTKFVPLDFDWERQREIAFY